MAVYTRMAVVKLDPADTFSTGGVVVDIVDWFDVSESIADGNTISADYGDAEGPFKNPYEDKSGYKCVASETAQIGWIMQDETNVLRDPNTQYKYILTK